MKPFDIVIPHFSNPRLNALAAACLCTIKRYSIDYKLIWIQNGGPVPAMLQKELAQHPTTQIILNEKNLGFVKATNQGLRASTAPYVVLMNNDTTAAPQWLEKLRKPLLAGYGIAGPLTTAFGSWQGRHKSNGLEFCDVPNAWPLAFFCTMIKREVIDQIGVLDEGFGVGLGDDDDYCARARRAGIRLALVQNLKIPHRHRSTFKTIYTQPQIHDMQRASVGRLQEKGAKI